MSSNPPPDPRSTMVDDISHQNLTVSNLGELFENCKTLSAAQVEEVGKRFSGMTVQLHEPSDFEVLTTLLEHPDFNNAVKTVDILIDTYQYHQRSSESIREHFQHVMRGVENATGLKTMRIKVIGPELGFIIDFGTLMHATLEILDIKNGTTTLESLAHFMDNAPYLRQLTAENLCITDNRLGSDDPPQVTECRASEVLREKTNLEMSGFGVLGGD
ncbi:hypothetical protein BST61_g2250 [Cercospora zeina]